MARELPTVRWAAHVLPVATQEEDTLNVQIGLQLYSVRESLAHDAWETLTQVARAGFTKLEAANHNARNDPGVGFGVQAKELRERLGQLGLSIVGCHINPLHLDILPRALDYQAELGNEQIGCDIEFFPYGDRDFVLRRCETFNEVGEMARQRGMRVYYHNHVQEFQRFGDDYVYDLILANTDPELVFLQLDTYWMYRGGQNPIDWMIKHADRIILLHQKDFPAEAPQPLNLYEGVVSLTENIDMRCLRIARTRCASPRSGQAFCRFRTSSTQPQSYLDLSTCCWNKTTPRCPS